jgi:NAD(P)-dependent dehydrogenase (short-subunit alcohol dehydrogenase family)
MGAPVLIVTAVGRGIGASTARLAASRGYAVCVNFLRDAEAAQSFRSFYGLWVST